MNIRSRILMLEFGSGLKQWELAVILFVTSNSESS